MHYGPGNGKKDLKVHKSKTSIYVQFCSKNAHFLWQSALIIRWGNCCDVSDARRACRWVASRTISQCNAFVDRAATYSRLCSYWQPWKRMIKGAIQFILFPADLPQCIEIVDFLQMSDYCASNLPVARNVERHAVR